MKLHRVLFISFVLAVSTFASSRAEVEKSPVLIIRMEHVFKESVAAQDVEKTIDELRQKYQVEFDSENTRLRSIEAELAEERDENREKPQFKSKIENFEQEVQQMRSLAQQRGNLLQNLLKQSMAQLRKDLMPILADIMDRYDASIMLDERDVILSSKSIDITEEAIAELNKKVQKIEISVPSQPEQRGAL
jgi:Skp family chaperone for outer membrane proteins